MTGEPATGKPMMSRSRGVIALLAQNCTVCMICARECPDWCIYIDSHAQADPVSSVPGAGPDTGSADGPADGSAGPAGGSVAGGRPRVRNVLDRFAIDFSLCMYCGICVEVCPFDALFWSPEAQYAEFDIADLTHEQDRLGGWLRGVPGIGHDPGEPG
jgi:NADH-quinone oxidoreductase subunit I